MANSRTPSDAEFDWGRTRGLCGQRVAKFGKLESGYKLVQLYLFRILYRRMVSE